MDIFSKDRWRDIASAARKAGASDWQVYKWKFRRSIPDGWHLRLLVAAREAGVPLAEEELLSTTSRSEVA